MDRRVVVCVLMCALCAHADSLESSIKTLNARLDNLLEKRQEDYRLLEESLRISLEKNSQLASLSSEVQSLR